MDILFKENIDLIIGVFDYQSNHTDEKKSVSKLEKIHGNMLVNPMSKFIYYDYLGLTYLHRSMQEIDRFLDLEIDSNSLFFCVDCMRQMHKSACDDKNKTQIGASKMFLNYALYCFEKAQKIAGEDLLLECFTKYNIAKVYVIKHILFQHYTKKEVKKRISVALNARENLEYYYIYSIKKDKEPGSYLEKKIKFEKKLAQKLLKEFMSYVEQE